MFLRHNFYLAPSTDGGGGTTEPDVKEPAAENTTEKNAEVEKMKAELEALKKEKADREAKAEEEKKAKMTAEEKAQAELSASRKALNDQHIALQLKSAGLSEDYTELFTADSPDKIQAKGALAQKLIKKIEAETEARVKRELARTKEPGSGDENKEMSAEEYYKSILN